MADNNRAIKDIVAGSFAGVVQVLSGQPFDLVKVRLQTSSSYNGTIDCVKKIYQNEGIAAFYKVFYV